MSKLIDDLIKDKPCLTMINRSWYIAKNVEFFGFHTIKQRIKDSIRVLIGKSRAYHFKQDEK